jgi:tetratricopeptide (TPR) repeat protein
MTVIAPAAAQVSWTAATSSTPAAPNATAASKAPPAAPTAAPDTGAKRNYDEGVAAYNAGQAELAIQKLTLAINAGTLKYNTGARALYYRGLAYRALKMSEKAIGDLTSALMRKNALNATERSEALSQRSNAYREAGLSDQDDTYHPPRPAVAAAPYALPTTPPPAQRIETGAIAPSPKPQPSPFGIQQAPAPAAPGTPESLTALFSSLQNALSPSDKPAATASGTWETMASRAQSAQPNIETPAKTSRVASTTPTVPAPDAVARAWRLQLSAHRSRDDAAAVLAKAQAQHAELTPAASSLDEETFGGVTFWRPHLGPFTDARTTQAICARLRTEGVDCMVMAN